jgi:hypothetical protein
MVQAIGFMIMWGMHEAVVADILRAVEIKVVSISIVSTMKKL